MSRGKTKRVVGFRGRLGGFRPDLRMRRTRTTVCGRSLASMASVVARVLHSMHRGNRRLKRW